MHLAAVSCSPVAHVLGVGGIGVWDNGLAGPCLGWCMGIWWWWCVGEGCVILLGCWKDLQTLTLAGLNKENPVPDPLAVLQHLDNRLKYMGKFDVVQIKIVWLR